MCVCGGGGGNSYHLMFIKISRQIEIVLNPQLDPPSSTTKV